MEETDEGYDEYLDGDPRTQQSTVRAQKTKGQYCFFFVLFSIFFLLLLLIFFLFFC